MPAGKYMLLGEENSYKGMPSTTDLLQWCLVVTDFLHVSRTYPEHSGKTIPAISCFII